jgi:hypothetical protein
MNVNMLSIISRCLRRPSSPPANEQLRHVLTDADHRQRLTVRRVLDLALRVQRPHRAVGQHDAMLDLIARTLEHCRLN